MGESAFAGWLIGRNLRARLFLMLGILGLLPVLGAVLELAAVQASREDQATLDKAIEGSVYLERTNGLLYSVLMESRGVFMSADTAAAAPFAANLLKNLDALKDVETAWRDNATDAETSGLAELSRRLDDFMTFRREIVRLAQEESPAAARAYSEKEAIKAVRTAISETLQALARSSEEEIKTARARIAASGRSALIGLIGLALGSLVTLGVAALFVNRLLMRPLFKIKTSMLKLAKGELDLEVFGADRRDEIGDMARAVEIFRLNDLERNKLTHEARLLSQFNAWLQSCKSLPELYDMVGEFVTRLLPRSAGNLYVYANSRDVLENVRAWNGAPAPSIHPDDCWGLRRGHAYTFGEHEIDFKCSHVEKGHEGVYCCLPVLAHGETIGMLHLDFGAKRLTGAGAIDADVAEQRRLGILCAEQISLAIANVKLRDQLRDQSIRDPLTGMFNRRYMLETCRREFSRAERNSQSVAVLSIDVDHFKKFNDNHGHDAGDIVLRSVGAALQSSFRDEDVPCRYGGEEFVVILPGSSLEEATRRADAVRADIEGLSVRYLDAALPRVTISIGVASFPSGGDTIETVLKAADEALYQAKEKGRNRVEQAAAPANSDLAAWIREADAAERARSEAARPERAEAA